MLKGIHKILGLMLTFFVIVYSLSGIFLNHRKALSGVDISRSILPPDYRYDNWNNSSVKGTFKLSIDSILMYGGAGVWLTDSLGNEFEYFMHGMKRGADNQNTINIVETKNKDVFALTTFGLYQLDEKQNRWINKSKFLPTGERLADITTAGDSIIVIDRSNAFVSTPPYTNFSKVQLVEPIDYSNEMSGFSAMWGIHSGQLWGLVGELVVDFVGVIFIVISITGIFIFFFPGRIRKIFAPEKKRKRAKQLKFNILWHNALGKWFFLLSMIVIVSGIFLRPPAMIYIIREKIKPLPGSIYKSANPWTDKLRNIRYDDDADDWLLFTSSGFYSAKNLESQPLKIKRTPIVSVMGVNVLKKEAPNLWLVGSFNGLYYWERQLGEVADVGVYPIYYKGQQINNVVPYVQKGVIGGIDVSGYSGDFSQGDKVFSYSKGALSINHSEPLTEMPTAIKTQPMSLWHVSLEAHVGRIFYPFINNLMGESMYVLITGIAFVIVYISGYIVYYIKRFKRKRSKKQ